MTQRLEKDGHGGYGRAVLVCLECTRVSGVQMMGKTVFFFVDGDQFPQRGGMNRVLKSAIPRKRSADVTRSPIRVVLQVHNQSRVLVAYKILG